MPELSVEERLARLEREVARLKLKVKMLHPKKDWITAITGTAKDDPDYEEILRLGKEIRDAERLDDDQTREPNG